MLVYEKWSLYKNNIFIYWIVRINVEKQLPSEKNNEKQQYEKINCEQGIISLFFV